MKVTVQCHTAALYCHNLLRSFISTDHAQLPFPSSNAEAANENESTVRPADMETNELIGLIAQSMTAPADWRSLGTNVGLDSCIVGHNICMDLVGI